MVEKLRVNGQRGSQNLGIVVRLHPLLHHLMLSGYLLEGPVRVYSLHLLRMHMRIFLSNAHLVLLTAVAAASSVAQRTARCTTIIDGEKVCLSVVSLVRHWLLMLPVLRVALASVAR